MIHTVHCFIKTLVTLTSLFTNTVRHHRSLVDTCEHTKRKRFIDRWDLEVPPARSTRGHVKGLFVTRPPCGDSLKILYNIMIHVFNFKLNIGNIGLRSWVNNTVHDMPCMPGYPPRHVCTLPLSYLLTLTWSPLDGLRSMPNTCAEQRSRQLARCTGNRLRGVDAR